MLEDRLNAPEASTCQDSFLLSRVGGHGLVDCRLGELHRRRAMRYAPQSGQCRQGYGGRNDVSNHMLKITYLRLQSATSPTSLRQRACRAISARMAESRPATIT